MKYKILVVDDEKDTCLSLDALLRWEGHNITTATNGKLALVEIENSIKINEPFDILITDLQMEGMTGFDLIAKINELKINLKIIIMSAYVKGEEIRKFCDSGAYIFIAKPIGKYELLNAINNTTIKILETSDTDIVTLIGILYDCPYDKALTSCPLKEIRDLDFKDRVTWASTLSEEDKVELISQHQECSCQRKLTSKNLTRLDCWKY